MKFKIQIVIDDGQGQTLVEDIFQLEKISIRDIVQVCLCMNQNNFYKNYRKISFYIKRMPIPRHTKTVPAAERKNASRATEPFSIEPYLAR